MEIRRCGREDYNGLLALLNRAFECAEPNAFERGVPIVTPFIEDATDEMIGRHLIALEGGEVIGCVGAYPCVLYTVVNGESKPVQTYGIGQVCCDERHRGKGVMTRLMDEAIEAEEEKADIGWLSGIRRRYRRFGFDFRGEKATFMMNAETLEGAGASRRMTEADIPAVSKLHEKFPTRIGRGKDYWRRLLMREGYHGWASCDLSAYAFYKAGFGSEKGGDIVELNGEPNAALALAADIAKVYGAKRINVRHPNTPHIGDKMYDALYDGCAWYTVSPAIMARGAVNGAFWIPEIDSV